MITLDMMRSNAHGQVMACIGYHELIAALDYDGIKAAVEIDSYGEPGYSVFEGIATIKVRGLLVPETDADLTSWGLTGYDILGAYLGNAAEDFNVDSVVLDISSPGGFIFGLLGVVDSIKVYPKPISAYGSGDIYSAAYYLASSVNGNLTVSQSSGVGSIGVYAEHFDNSGALEKKGTIRSIFKSGFWKGAFSSLAPLSKQEAERLQQSVDESAAEFFAHVAIQRRLSAAKIKKLEGDSFNADRALEIGLIDEIIKGDKAMSVTNQVKNAAGASPAAFTQEDIDAAVNKAVIEATEKALATAMAFADRQAAIKAFDISDDAKAILGGQEFQDVSIEKLGQLANAFPKSMAVQMAEAGGACVGADRQEFAPKSTGQVASDKKAAEQDAALAVTAKATKGII